jgi:hypothetical protein
VLNKPLLYLANAQHFDAECSELGAVRRTILVIMGIWR